MVAHIDYLIALLFVHFMFAYGKHSLNDSSSAEVFDSKASLTKVEYFNDSSAEEDAFHEGDLRMNASSLYMTDEVVVGNVTDVLANNDSSHDVNGTDTRNGTKDVPPKSTGNNCTVCAIRDGDREFRIRAIKNTILERLHFHNLPNMTGRTLPKAPRFSHLLERSEIQSDAPVYQSGRDYYEYYDHSYGYTERMFTIAKARK